MTGEAPASPAAIVVATIDEARTAISAAARRGAMARLESPPDAAIIHGVLWFSEMQRVLATEFPPGSFSLTLDCGDRPDLAHSALAEGLRSIRLACHPAARAAIEDIARQLGAEVRSPPRETAMPE
jgi:hypothetical protein